MGLGRWGETSFETRAGGERSRTREFLARVCAGGFTPFVVVFRSLSPKRLRFLELLSVFSLILSLLPGRSRDNCAGGQQMPKQSSRSILWSRQPPRQRNAVCRRSPSSPRRNYVSQGSYAAS